ncbi:putative acrylyl-CoA reductase AcuI [bacterium HR40]|nr:putative acrylyl-CoA reductase AcuI [bacterium HR40]
MAETFEALVLDRVDGRTVWRLERLPVDRLPPGDVLVDVDWSCLNYKDALAITGAGKIVREFPFVPGIDFAGRVRESADPRFRPGDRVVLTGWGVGERHWGGLAELARVPGDWLLPLPEGLTTRQAMAIGTAGFTAMLAVLELAEQGLSADAGDVLVSGAAGGVGSLAVALLAGRGHRVVASTGRPELADWLRELGASEILKREVLAEPSKAPLESQRWAGAVDTVGGTTLANILKATRYRGVVTACGLAGGAEFTCTVYPFILRGVRLIGIDSVYCPRERRERVWRALVRELSPAVLERVTSEISLKEAGERAADFLSGRVRGRLVVRVQGGS